VFFFWIQISTLKAKNVLKIINTEYPEEDFSKIKVIFLITVCQNCFTSDSRFISGF